MLGMAIVFRVRLYASGQHNQPRKMSNVLTSARVSVPILRAFCYWFMKQNILNKKKPSHFKQLENFQLHPIYFCPSGRVIRWKSWVLPPCLNNSVTGSMLNSLHTEDQEIISFPWTTFHNGAIGFILSLLARNSQVLQLAVFADAFKHTELLFLVTLCRQWEYSATEFFHCTSSPAWEQCQGFLFF